MWILWFLASIYFVSFPLSVKMKGCKLKCMRMYIAREWYTWHSQSYVCEIKGITVTSHVLSESWCHDTRATSGMVHVHSAGVMPHIYAICVMMHMHSASVMSLICRQCQDTCAFCQCHDTHVPSVTGYMCILPVLCHACAISVTMNALSAGVTTFLPLVSYCIYLCFQSHDACVNNVISYILWCYDIYIIWTVSDSATTLKATFQRSTSTMCASNGTHDT